jgi:hypothetical protein
MSILDSDDKILKDAFNSTVIDIVCSNPNVTYLGTYNTEDEALMSSRVRDANQGIFVVNGDNYRVWYNNEVVYVHHSDLKNNHHIFETIMTGTMSDHIAECINKRILETMHNMGSKYETSTNVKPERVRNVDFRPRRYNF